MDWIGLDWIGYLRCYNIGKKSELVKEHNTMDKEKTITMPSIKTIRDAAHCCFLAFDACIDDISNDDIAPLINILEELVLPKGVEDYNEEDRANFIRYELAERKNREYWNTSSWAGPSWAEANE